MSLDEKYSLDQYKEYDNYRGCFECHTVKHLLNSPYDELAMKGAIFGVPITFMDRCKPGTWLWCDWILLGESCQHGVEPEPRLKAAHVEGTTFDPVLGGRRKFKRLFVISREFVEGPALWAGLEEAFKAGDFPLEVKPRDERRQEADAGRL